MSRKTVSRVSLASFAGAAALLTACATDVSVDTPLTPDTSTPVAPSEKFVRAAKPIPGQYIVVMEAPKDAEARAKIDIASVASGLAGTYQAEVEQTWSSAVLGWSGKMTETAARQLADDPAVAYVEEDGEVTIDATQQNAVFGLDRIDQNNLPLNRTFNFNNEGEGVTAFIIDTGIRTTHREFAGRAVGGADGFDAIRDGQGTNDCNGHGTHVAGTVGSATFGVAKKVKLVAVRVLGCTGSGANSGVVAGIDFVARTATAQGLKGKAVANMSLGGGASRATDDAVQRAVSAGVVMAVAAGNENADACGSSPARAPNAITVGASRSDDARASFSNFGRCVDIFAPGQGILSTSQGSDTATATLSGTSMAAPHVAGAVALFLAANPNSTPAQVAAGLIDNASNNKISDVKGSPNKLLFTGFIGAGGGNPGEPQEPTPPPPTGTPRTGSGTRTVAAGQLSNFQALPVLGGTKVVVTMTGNGDAELVVRFDAAPAFGQPVDCLSDNNGSTERCELTAPADAENFTIGVLGFARSSTVTVNAQWTEP